jgi:hypothetical protein
MNESLLLGILAALAGGFVGALLSGFWVRRQLRSWLATQPVQPVQSVQAEQWQALQVALARMPQSLQEALQAELDLFGHQQAQRDVAIAQREEARGAVLRALVESLSAAKVPRPAPPRATTSPALAPALAPPAPSAPEAAVSARPPELLLTPLPEPAPVYEAPAPERELTDEEIDALPPEPLVTDKPRKRVLPPPKKPVMRSL